MVAVSGWSRAAVYEAVQKLEAGGFCASVLHATELLPPARRFHLTAAGLRRLAGEEDTSLDELVRSRPVSAQWRRGLMERLDALAAVYHLACLLSNVAFPIRFRWYRAVRMDAAVTLPDGKTVGIVRQGRTADRSGFAKRLWRLRDEPMPGAVLVLMADDVRLRHARRLLSTTEVPALFALEREAVLAEAGDRIWSPPRVGASVDLRYVLDRTDPGGELPVEDEPQRVSAPDDIPDKGAAWDMDDHLLPVFLKPAEKRALDMVSDWPWITLTDLAGLLGVSVPRASQLVNPLEGFRLVARPRHAGRRLALTDRGLTLLARRDRTSVGVAKRRWSVAPEDADAPFEWRNLTGRRSRQLFRNIEHTAAVPRLPGRAHRAGPPAGLGDRPARPAPQGLPPLQARRRDARRQPRRLRRPHQGRHALALLPGVGAPRRAPLHHVGAARPLSALLLVAQARRRPRHAALRPGRLRRRDRPHPLPARGPGGDAGGGGHPCPCGSPTRRP